MALDHAVEALEKGELIVVFPEGTVTTDPDLRPAKAKTGMARLALRTHSLATSATSTFVRAVRRRHELRLPARRICSIVLSRRSLSSSMMR
jgi:1-acyl-sn-glycerol-3-phosphate acyltransferase